MPSFETEWQDIAWNGVSLRLPASWTPTVIQQSYLFFEEQGRPAFAIKWNRIRGRFSAQRILERLQKSAQGTPAKYSSAPIPQELLPFVKEYSAAGFECRDPSGTSQVFLLFCPHCGYSTMLQFYPDSLPDTNSLPSILASFSDHPQRGEQNWSIYDIRARLPVQANLQSHEFLAGRYTLSFALPDTEVSLYRFKPAATILTNRSLVDFGTTLAGKAVCVYQDKSRLARWEFEASGLNRFVTLAGKKPGWIWLQLEHIVGKNAILAVKGSGRGSLNRVLMEKISANFSTVNPL